MNPGLPGTGIGGLFYILSAIWMPVRELWRLSTGPAGEGARWLPAIKQSGIAIGIVVVMAVVFWMLDIAIVHYEAGEPAAAGREQYRIFRVSALLVTSGLLALVLGAMQALRLWAARF